LIFDRFARARRPALAAVVNQKIAGEPRQLYLKRTFARAEALQRLEHAQKYFLRDVLRLAIGACEAVTDSVDALAVQAYEVLPSGFIAAQAPFWQLCVGVQGCLPLLPTDDNAPIGTVRAALAMVRFRLPLGVTSPYHEKFTVFVRPPAILRRGHP